MQSTALRLASRSQLRAAFARQAQRRLIATTASSSDVAASLSSSSASAPSSSSSARTQNLIPISNIEAQWAKMSLEDKFLVNQQLEEIMKRDWKTLSVDEKKAAYYVSFGPHGPRTPTSRPGDGIKIFTAVLGIVGATALVNGLLLWNAPEKPKTISKEWQEASNERAKEKNLNPITGISSEGYSGKGFVTAKN